MNNGHKWRVTFYKGLAGSAVGDRDIFEEVHVTSDESIDVDEIRRRAYKQVDCYPRSHHTKITRIK